MRSGLTHGAWLATVAVLSIWTDAVRADYTEVHGPYIDEAGHEEILEGIYGGDFVSGGIDLRHGQWTVFDNGTTTVTRVDDLGIGALL